MIYFDNASSMAVNTQVLKHFQEKMAFFASSSSIHQKGIDAFIHLQNCRKQLASMLKVKEKELIFTSGASESNNMILKGFLNKRKKHIITTAYEHPSVFNTCKQLEQNFAYQVTYLKPNNIGQIDLKQLATSLTPDTLLVSIIYVNNEVGSINNMKGIKEIIDKYNKENHQKVLLHTDITQALGKVKVDFNDFDLASFSFHKVGGFKGCGFAFIKSGIDLLPLITGGGQEFSKRAGTVNVASISANVYSLQLALTNFKNNLETVSLLSDMLLAEMKKIDAVLINTPENHCGYIVNFSLPGYKSQVLVNAFSSFEIYLSALASCSSNYLYSNTLLAMFDDKVRAASSLRVSFSSQNTIAEVQQFILILKKILKEVSHGNNNDKLW